MKRTVASALIICTRRIGDVLLATPVVRSIKAAYPDAAVDMLVFDGTQDVIAANPDIRRIWTIAERATIRAQLAMVRSLWRRYDVALSVFGGDRPILFACLAGRYRIGTLGPYNNSWWKRRLLNVWVPFDRVGTHTVAMNLRLLEPLGIEPCAAPVVGWMRADEEAAEQLFRGASSGRRYAVLHVSPKFAYKMWTAAGWAGLGRWLTDQGLTVVVAGGDGPAERAYCEDVTRRLPVGSVNLAGQMRLPALGYLLSRAALYVGTDTAVSHMAAAVGTPTVVLFGPSSPVKWGPWPKDFTASGSNPWKIKGSQRQGNVWLLQGEGDCVPCLAEGCGRHINSVSDCLQNLSVDRVIQAAEQMLVTREDRRDMTAVR
ncbi:MAG: putative lipopolysaccharide heptosyltransferase III [Nitrospira sp.]|nr:putative lipopolysaccharide heptosyltransferase III [Nitrospira sp.]